MRQGKGSFAAGVLVGVIAGLTAGMVTVAHSTTGKKAWDRFGDMFQAGYVSGFLDCVSIAKAMDRESYVARNYIMPPAIKPSHYQVWINEAYQDPKNGEKTVPQLLVLAGYRLQAKYGPEVPPNDVSMEALRSAVDARRSAYREAEAARKELEAAKSADGVTDPPAPAPQGAQDSNAPNASPPSSGAAEGAPPPAK